MLGGEPVCGCVTKEDAYGGLVSCKCGGVV